MGVTFGKDGYPEIKEFKRYGWRGCWKCQHCLAVCAQGAISIFNKKPEESLPPPPSEMGGYMERLIVHRRSCNVEYTIIDDKDSVKEIWRTAAHGSPGRNGEIE